MIYNILIFILSAIFLIIATKFNKYKFPLPELKILELTELSTEKIKDILNINYKKEKEESSNLYKYLGLFFTIFGALATTIITIFLNKNNSMFFNLYIITTISVIFLLYTIQFNLFVINTIIKIYQYKTTIKNLEKYLKYDLFQYKKEKKYTFIIYLVDGISVLFELIISFSITFLIYKNYSNLLLGIHDYLIVILLFSIFNASRKVYIKIKL
ncbi:hypothetical protein [Brachyspira pilosicoli]|uniref:hypothetical protein n=1 Tax=Brachyspira pilosicoli TaxID=52584 RepID=UPI000E16D1A5|nr:hypothetical protein [Brachyspira pilosicoli]SUW04488.1 Uncharacterised protein [Brachyspira pilosicoli]